MGKVRGKTSTSSKKCRRSESACKTCGKIFRNDNLLRHMKTHNKPMANPNSSYKCEICNLSFERKYNLSIHFKAKHDHTIPRVQCNMCKKTYSNITNLNVHKKTVHASSVVVPSTVALESLSVQDDCKSKNIENHTPLLREDVDGELSANESELAHPIVADLVLNESIVSESVTDISSESNEVNLDESIGNVRGTVCPTEVPEILEKDITNTESTPIENRIKDFEDKDQKIARLTREKEEIQARFDQLCVQLCNQREVKSTCSSYTDYLAAISSAASIVVNAVSPMGTLNVATGWNF